MKKEVGRIIRKGVCQKSDDEIIRQALLDKAYNIESRLAVDKTLSPNHRKALQDEYERTFALSGKYSRR